MSYVKYFRHIEFIFVYGKRMCFNYIDLHKAVQFSQHHLLKKQSSPLFLPPLLRIIYSEVAQSCPSLWDPMGCSLPGSSVHGVFQVIVVKWIAISFSRDLPNPGIAL